MAAKRDKASGIANSLADLMSALKVEVHPPLSEMQKQGWITAKDFANAARVNILTAKRMLDAFPNVKKLLAKDARHIISVYKLKK